jgi:hypothetical protein
MDKAHRAASLLWSRPAATGVPKDHPVIMTLRPRARAQAASGLGLRRPERRRRRWRLWMCHRISEVGDDLGMRQAMSQSPSKPVAPVGCQLPCAGSMGPLPARRKGGDAAMFRPASCRPTGDPAARRPAARRCRPRVGRHRRADAISGTPRPSVRGCARRGCCR